MQQELTNWQQFQLNRWGDILPIPDMEIEEPGEKESERYAEWSHMQYERQLHEYDKD
jgi:hypothetical protein